MSNNTYIHHTPQGKKKIEIKIHKIKVNNLFKYPFQYVLLDISLHLKLQWNKHSCYRCLKCG